MSAVVLVVPLDSCRDDAPALINIPAADPKNVQRTERSRSADADVAAECSAPDHIQRLTNCVNQLHDRYQLLIQVCHHHPESIFCPSGTSKSIISNTRGISKS